MSTKLTDFLESAKEAVSCFVNENLLTTKAIAVSVSFIVADIGFNYMRKEIRQKALVDLLKKGDSTRKEKNKKGTTIAHHDDNEDAEEEEEEEEEKVLHIDRSNETLRLMYQLSHKSTIPLIVSSVGDGTTTLCKQIAQKRPSTKYISLEHCKTVEDLCLCLRREFDLPDDVGGSGGGYQDRFQMSSFSVIMKLVRGLQGVVASVADSSSSSSEEESESSDSEIDEKRIFRFLALFRALQTAADKAKQMNIKEKNKKLKEKKEKEKKERKKTNNNSSIQSTTSTATAASSSSSSSPNASASPCCETLANSSFISIFRRNHDSNENHNHPNNEEDDEEDVDDILYSETTPLIIFDDANELDEKAVKILSSVAASSDNLRLAFVAGGPYKFFATKHAHAVKTLKPHTPSYQSLRDYVAARCQFLAATKQERDQKAADLVDRVTGADISLVVQLCVRLEELVCDSVAPVSKMTSSQIAEILYQTSFRGYAFGTTRVLHLYTTHATGDKELDQERLTVFRILILLIDATFSATSSCCSVLKEENQEKEEKDEKEEKKEEEQIEKCDRHLPAVEQVILSYEEALNTEIKFEWFLRVLETKREFLQGVVFTFNRIRFRAALYRRTAIEVLGIPGSERRKKAEENLKKLEESFDV